MKGREGKKWASGRRKETDRQGKGDGRRPGKEKKSGRKEEEKESSFARKRNKSLENRMLFLKDFRKNLRCVSSTRGNKILRGARRKISRSSQKY
jgi:hypothetical protein